MNTVESTDIAPSFSRKQQCLPWIVCFSAALFFFYEFIQMNMFNSINQELMRDFHLEGKTLSLLSSVYFLSNVIFLLPAGFLLDRLSTRKLILTAMGICVGGTLLFALAQNIWVAFLCRFLTGIGSAFCFLSCVRLASRWFPPRHMALVTGLIVTMAMIGGMVAQSPMAELTLNYGWRHALMIDAGLGAIIIFVVFLFVRDYPEDHAHQVEEEHEELHKMGFLESLRLSYLNFHNWLGGIYTCMLNLPLMILGGTWGSLFLMQVHHLNKIGASYVIDMLFLGTIIGSPMAGWFSDFIGQRKTPMVLGAVLSLIATCFAFYLPNLGLTTLMVLFFIVGFVTSTQVISYPTIAETNPASLTASSVSVVSFSTIGGGGVVLLPFFGWLMSLGWNHQMIDGVANYSLHNYHGAMLLFPLATVIALLTLFGIKETNCKQAHL